MKRRVSTAKRIVAVALAATVAVSLTGCKKRKNKNDTTSSDVTTSQSQAAVPETPEVTATPAPTATPEPTAAPAENTDKKDNATSEPTKTNKPSSGTSTSGGTTKPVATKTPAPAPAVTPAPTAKPQVKYTFTVRHHDATCTTQGYDEHICHEWGGMNYNDHFVPAKGHSWDGGTVMKAATYTETGIKTFKCKDCDETRTEEIPSLDKTYHIKSVVAPTCTSEGYTIYECNEVPGLTYKGDFKAKLPHAYDAGKVTKPATIYGKGVKTFTCNVCQATKTEDIAKVHEHDYTRLGEIIEGPFCEAEGKRWMYCSYEGCNERVVKPVPAIGYHDWDPAHTECLKKATCTEKDTMLMHCKRDASHTMTYDYGGTGHTWDEGVITTPPTYDDYGEKTLHCKNCDATKTEKVLPTKYTFTVTVVPPTCTEDGYTMHKCNEDDTFSYKDNIVHSTGHRAAKRVIEPTCKEEGRTEIYCTVCGDVSTVLSTTPQKDHTWDDGVVTTKPTAEKEGVKTYTCKVCNETKTESIPRLNSSGK